MSNTDLSKPIIHLNGTGAETLLDEYTSAMNACHDACEALKKMTVHPRDYYVSQDPQAYDKARDQHIARHDAINKVFHEIEALALHVIATR